MARFEAKKALGNSQQPISMQSCNEVARAVDQDPGELVAFLDDVQRNNVCTPVERALCVIVRGLLIKAAQVPGK